MAACPNLVYFGVTPAAWARIVAAAEQYGITAAPSGSATVSGFTVEWTYAEKNLTVACTDSPWFVGCDAINAHIDAAIKGAIA